jgi:hypothetical protein
MVPLRAVGYHLSVVPGNRPLLHALDY